MRMSGIASLSGARSRTRNAALARSKYISSSNSSSSRSSRISGSRFSRNKNSRTLTTANVNQKLNIYGNIETAAKDLLSQLTKLSAKDTDLYQVEDASTKEDTKATETTATETKAEEKKTDTAKKETSKVDSAILTFIKDYNTMYTNMKNSGDTLNTVYAKNLKKEISAQAKELSKIGISIGYDGTLSANSKKLEEASMEDKKNVFGYGKSMSRRIPIYTESIKKNAEKEKTSWSKKASQLNSTATGYSQNYSRYADYIADYYKSLYSQYC